ncbi:acyl-CoA dehydrogenase/oxidase [Fusarium acuminatum]|uniref:Acyl-CoA dehydrogenase/oxidase n=1 Tax=Fusarium acuminatum TaxID=5515 RepID=A0ABZ2WRW5_9HYPO
MATPVFESSDPTVYNEYEAQWSTLPTDAEGWIKRAQDVADVLAKDAPARERANKSPKAEVALLKHSGLLKILGPAKYGGGEQPWSVAFRAVREVTKKDGSVGMLLGYHLVWSATANVVGTPEQAERTHKLILSNNYFVGGAVNPRDSDLKITSDGDKIIFNGFKNFSTGGVISDLTVLEGVYGDKEEHIFAIVPTQQPGIQFKHNWDNVGLRLTESGSVNIENVSAPIQLNFANLYLGLAAGALEFAQAYTLKNTRAWPFGGDNKEKATDEFYILSTYGNFFAHQRAAEALAEKVNAQADALYATYSQNRSGVTAEQRGEFAEWVASLKVVTTDTGLRITSGVFEVTGSRATSAKTGLDRFWRDLRTHTLHDPVAYKNRELGRYFLLGEYPELTWYT